MAPLSKPKRTSKTSQKLVVLPSGPQTKPLADDGEEASDDAALPTVALNRPPRRAPTTRRPAPEQLRALKHERARTTEEEKPHDGEATKRVREYKSEAERMTKEERKKAGHKRITAYCVAEGLKMKQLTGFLKREHNVTPRVFDEAVYVVYQLPLLPGYGPNINVRSSAHTGPETDKPGKSQLLSTLQEAEEDGYNDTYFPQPVPGLEEPPRLQRSHSSSHMVSESEPIPVEPMPGLVHAASVEEVRGGDGYMTSGSFPDHSAMPEHLERGYGAYGSFQPSYDPYPSSLESSPVTLRDTHIPERYSEAQVADVVFPTPFLQRAESSDAEPQTPGMDSGVETDDPGAYTDPGVYGEYPWDPKSTLARNDSQDTEVSQSENDMAKSARTEYTNKTIQRLQEGSSGSDVTTKGAAGQTTNETSVNVVETNPAATASELSLASETFGPISAYREQLDHEHERQVVQDAQAEYEEQREERRKLEYERALERERQRERERELDNIGEVVFFDYGVIVFFGLDERGERDVLEDISKAGGMKRSIKEDEWEIEECHFTHDSQITYPRIYNDFFTLKSRSHLLKLSIAHALAQSTLLARYESLAGHTLTSPIALSIPRQMAESGSLQLRRNEALKLTGRLFKLRRDVNLVSNVLDVPELFWDEASLKELYDAVRDYMEIDPRVENLNEKLVVASDFVSLHFLPLLLIAVNVG
ncbi:YagE family protein [Coprinopsis sp. MPI-PUGE-AT-0042]|nr:YagE family protein [Coprinopsis sp. MPI-PUGE-AT-0042]